MYTLVVCTRSSLSCSMPKRLNCSALVGRRGTPRRGTSRSNVAAAGQSPCASAQVCTPAAPRPGQKREKVPKLEPRLTSKFGNQHFYVSNLNMSLPNHPFMLNDNNHQRAHYLEETLKGLKTSHKTVIQSVAVTQHQGRIMLTSEY